MRKWILKLCWVKQQEQFNVLCCEGFNLKWPLPAHMFENLIPALGVILSSPGPLEKKVSNGEASKVKPDFGSSLRLLPPGLHHVNEPPLHVQPLWMEATWGAEPSLTWLYPLELSQEKMIPPPPWVFGYKSTKTTVPPSGKVLVGFCLFVWDRVSCWPSWPCSCVEASLELGTLLALPPKS